MSIPDYWPSGRPLHGDEGTKHAVDAFFTDERLDLDALLGKSQIVPWQFLCALGGLASPVPVEPFARLRIEPSDFPFLDRIFGHDDDRLPEYAEAVMTAAPWPE